MTEPLTPITLRLPRDRALPLDRPRIMGIINVTPDSFSDGGKWLERGAALAHAKQLVAEGAEVLDIGGESTRPGSQRVDVDEQRRRVEPVVAAVREALPEVVISIDTTRAAVAEAALDAGADMLNDVSGAMEDPTMLALAAERSVPIVLMHMRGEPGTMQDDPRYDDVVAEIRDDLVERAEAAVAAGVANEQVMIDPGIGFGKTREHNLALMANLAAFVETEHAVLLGTSRKRFMGSICTEPDGSAPKPETLVGATAATTAIGVAAGVAMFRVHDVRANRQAADVAWAVERTRG